MNAGIGGNRRPTDRRSCSTCMREAMLAQQLPAPVTAYIVREQSSPQERWEDWRKVNERVSRRGGAGARSKTMSWIEVDGSDATKSSQEFFRTVPRSGQQGPDLLRGHGQRRTPVSRSPGLPSPERVKLSLPARPTSTRVVGQLAKEAITDEQVAAYYEENKESNSSPPIGPFSATTRSSARPMGSKATCRSARTPRWTTTCPRRRRGVRIGVVLNPSRPKRRQTKDRAPPESEADGARGTPESESADSGPSGISFGSVRAVGRVDAVRARPKKKRRKRNPPESDAESGTAPSEDNADGDSDRRAGVPAPGRGRRRDS